MNENRAYNMVISRYYLIFSCLKQTYIDIKQGKIKKNWNLKNKFAKINDLHVSHECEIGKLFLCYNQV